MLSSITIVINVSIIIITVTTTATLHHTLDIQIQLLDISRYQKKDLRHPTSDVNIIIVIIVVIIVVT